MFRRDPFSLLNTCSSHDAFVYTYDELPVGWWSDRFFRPPLMAMPISMVVVAVMPVSMVMAPSPISGCPAVINASIPIPRSMDVIRPIVTADGDLHRLNGRY